MCEGSAQVANQTKPNENKIKSNVKLFSAFQIAKAWTQNKSNNEKLNVVCIITKLDPKTKQNQTKRSQTVNSMLSSFSLNFF